MGRAAGAADMTIDEKIIVVLLVIVIVWGLLITLIKLDRIEAALKKLEPPKEE